jgi:hypothetical protein
MPLDRGQAHGARTNPSKALFFRVPGAVVENA